MYAVQNPNALDSKVIMDFDHFKHNLKVDDEGMLHPAALLSLMSYESCLVLMLLLLLFYSVLAMTPSFLFLRTKENEFRSNLQYKHVWRYQANASGAWN